VPTSATSHASTARRRAARSGFLIQRDADYSLAAQSADEAIAHGRSIVAARLAATGENPSGPGQVRQRVLPHVGIWLTAILLAVAALRALVVRARSLMA
jgi:hypothetical protein